MDFGENKKNIRTQIWVKNVSDMGMRESNSVH